MPTELFHRDGHRCLMFSDLGDDAGEAVQANQFLIVDDDTGTVSITKITDGEEGPPIVNGKFRITRKDGTPY